MRPTEAGRCQGDGIDRWAFTARCAKGRDESRRTLGGFPGHPAVKLDDGGPLLAVEGIDKDVLQPPAMQVNPDPMGITPIFAGRGYDRGPCADRRAGHPAEVRSPASSESSATNHRGHRSIAK